MKQHHQLSQRRVEANDNRRHGTTQIGQPKTRKLMKIYGGDRVRVKHLFRNNSHSV